MRYKWLWTSSGAVVLALLALATIATPALAQTGSIEGTVRNAQTAAPVGGARVIVVGTDLAATTNPDGYYRINDVPAGTHEVRAAIIGYTAVTVGNVSVAVGLPVTLNIQLQPSIIRLDEVVVTGVIGETQRAKLPFTVESISGDELEVPQVDAVSAISGKVAGATVVRGTGRPGAAPTILLRAPTSIDASGRSQEPLFVVDGVILGESMVDLDALDIENIEVIKGAAAASLYGSRAASGVVQIQTRRGSGLPQEEIRFTVRSEFGMSQLPGKFDAPLHHQHLMTADGSQFVDASGNPCDWLECPSVQPNGTDDWDTFMVGAWPGTTYDNVDRFFDPGNFYQNYLAAEGRSGGTNFHASWSNLREEGVLMGKEGFRRNNFRVNVDQRLGTSFKIGASAFYSRSTQDFFGESQGNTLFDLTRMPAGVDLLSLNACPSTGTCDAWQEPRLLPDGTQDPNDVYLNPDPSNNESPNPLYETLNIDDQVTRGRFLGSANVRWSPLHWLSVDGNVSYDRLDYKNQYYRFKGFKSITPSSDTQGGGLERIHRLTEAFNASANLTLNYRFGDLATRAQFRYLMEWDEYQFTNAGSDRFAVADVPTLDNLETAQIYLFESGLEPVRADAYFGIVNFDYKDRFIVDALVRNDGSSLFGPEERRQWYWRLAGAWRVTESFQVPAMDELKLRLAYGTAGGRPRFNAQYETYEVSGGQVSPQTLGNRNLKPEYSQELEAGVDMLMFGMAGLSVTYAKTKTTDQILLVPLQGYAGFESQWQNAGTLESNTWEAMLDLQLVQTRSVTWNAKVLFDRTRQEITELTVPPFTYGVGGQAMGDVFYARPGESLGQFYGMNYATSCDHLLGGAPCDEFAVNDDGLLVWVGPGGSLDNPQWGTSRTDPFGFLGTNQTLMWGTPFFGWGTDRVSGDTTTFLPSGNTQPNYSLGFSTTVSFGGLSLYGLIESVQGFDVYNQPQQWAIFKNYGGIEDQIKNNVPESQWKPLGYYGALYGVAGLSPVNWFLQDGSFTKLREVSLKYRFSRDQLAGVSFLRWSDGIAISAIGRNLITWSSYNGYDPETGRGGGDTGSAAIARVDGYNYPNFRTFTFALEVNF